ncbi:MAG: 4-hydroxy-3-methylbut-2-enyl diphosphate reductase [bacterium]
MIVLRAQALGMCFGVRDALAMAAKVERPRETSIYGELVHNEEVLDDLARRGFKSLSESERGQIPSSRQILITAHGISGREKNRLARAGKYLIDASCPLVRHVHEAARRLDRLGYFVVVIGKPHHVEVRGIVGDLDRYAVVAKPEDARVWDAPRLGIVCQTTTPPREAIRIRAAIRAMNPGKEIRYIDTICRPTRERQEAALELLERVEALVVVGGKHSNNTRQLAALAESRRIPVLHVQGPDDLDPEWFAPFEIVGLTAGTSTLDHTVDEVHDALLAMNPNILTHAKGEIHEESA